MIARQDALALIRKYIKKENTIKHMLATEAIMRVLHEELRKRGSSDESLGGTSDEWAMAGLMHDLDYETAIEREHGVKVFEILNREKTDLPPAVIQAIQAHCFNLHPEFEPKTPMDWALFTCDSLTGLIVATALVRPDKKLASVKVKSIKKKFKDKAFAAGTRREDIALCAEKLGIPLDKYIEISLGAMQSISKDLGL